MGVREGVLQSPLLSPLFSWIHPIPPRWGLLWDSPWGASHVPTSPWMSFSCNVGAPPNTIVLQPARTSPAPQVATPCSLQDQDPWAAFLQLRSLQKRPSESWTTFTHLKHKSAMRPCCKAGSWTEAFRTPQKEDRLRVLGLFSLERKGSKGISSRCMNTWWEDAKRTKPGFFQWWDKRQKAQNETPEHEEMLHYCEGDCAQAQVAQRRCEGSSTAGAISHLSTKAFLSIIVTALQQAFWDTLAAGEVVLHKRKNASKMFWQNIAGVQTIPSIYGLTHRLWRRLHDDMRHSSRTLICSPQLSSFHDKDIWKDCGAQ